MTPCARPHPQKCTCGSITRTPSTPRTAICWSISRCTLPRATRSKSPSIPRHCGRGLPRPSPAALWQAAARVVIHVEALEEQRTHPDAHIEQLLAYMTPCRYAGDQPLPRGIHDGTWFPTSRRMPLTAAAGADVPPPDARAGAPARAATPPVTPAVAAATAMVSATRPPNARPSAGRPAPRRRRGRVPRALPSGPGKKSGPENRRRHR